jgi:GntR family transcriptional regulator, rspAB operon transcriptional repressor
MASTEISLAESVYLQIRDGILSGEFQLGESLSRRRLAERFGMSLIPVAEALQRLEREGLVESRARSGTHVRIPTAEEVRGHYLVREALETQAARLFAERANARQRRRLAAMARRIDALFNSSPLARMDRTKQLFEMHRLHMQFHMCIAESTGCRELIQALQTNQVLIFHWLYNSAAHFDTLPPRWHQDLVEALSSGKPALADRVMRHHVRFRTEEVAMRIGAYLPAVHRTGSADRKRI